MRLLHRNSRPDFSCLKFVNESFFDAIPEWKRTITGKAHSAIRYAKSHALDLVVGILQVINEQKQLASVLRIDVAVMVFRQDHRGAKRPVYPVVDRGDLGDLNR